MRLIALLLLTLPLCACSTLPNGRGWGEDAGFDRTDQDVAYAADRAVRSPSVWGPALAALVVGVSGADQRLSDWARRERPLFGKSGNTAKATDDLRTATTVGMFTTALATPSGPSDEFVENKGRGVGIEAAAAITSINVTSLLKAVVGRKQPVASPDSDGHESFVSHHATVPFTHATLADRNTDFLALPAPVETAFDSAFYLMAAGSAWGRVEMGLHYPSDQLAGAAIGNFIGLFFHYAFMGTDKHRIGAQAGEVPMITLGIGW